jgi:hypothetical protein
MSRSRNPLGAKQLRYSGNRVIAEYLEEMVKTGLYGRTPGEAAERLVSQGIERLIQQGTIRRRTPQGGE